MTAGATPPTDQKNGPSGPVIRVPPSPPPLPGLPDYVPPLDTGQPSAVDINDLSKFRRQLVAAENTVIPVTYGRDRYFGALFVLHIDELAGFMYVAYGFCKGEIDSFETIYMDGVDIADPLGFLSFAGAVKEEHLGTSTQAASTLLSAALAGFSDQYLNLAYLVFKVPVDTTQGFPRVEAIIRGKKLYDPRLDDLVTGGVGPQRLATPSTWTFSANPTLALYDFIRTNTDWVVTLPDLMLNATHNDELLGGVRRRELGLTLFKPALVNKWMKVFRLYCGAFFTWENGELRVITEQADVLAPGAVNLDGVNGSEILVGDIATTDFAAGQDFTIEILFKTETPISTNVTLVSTQLNVTTAQAGFSLVVSSGLGVSANVGDGVDGVILSSGASAFDDNQWHHVAMIVDRTAQTLNLIVDDVEAPGGAKDITLVGSLSTTEDFRIGNDGSGTKAWSNLIDELRIWNTVRTPAELIANKLLEIPNPALNVDLIGYWKFNDVTGSIAVDSSISGNNGTLTPSTAFTTGNLLLLPEGVIRHFTADDIHESGFSIKKKSNRQFPTQVQVEYTDASGVNWPVARQRASAPGVEEGTSPKRISRISLPGIHNAAQAKRCAIERLNWMISDLDVKLTVFDEGIEIQNGSIIAVTHPLGLTNKMFRVRSITGTSGRWTIDGSEYDPQIYSNEVITNPTFPDTQLGDPLNPPQVQSLTAVEELFITKDGNTSSRVRVNWTDTPFPFFSQYRVEGFVSGTRVWQTFVGVNEAISPAVEQLVGADPVAYSVSVFIHSGFAVGTAAQVTLDILGKLAPPGDVASITATRVGADSVRLNWTAAVDIDIWRYDVRRGTVLDTFDTAIPIELVDGLTFTVEGLAAGVVHRFFVKAVDSVNNVSVNAAIVDLTLTDPTAVTSLTGFEIGGEVRLSWEAPVDDDFVARYRVAYSDVPQTFEKTLDITDSLVFNTKDIPAGTFTFKVYSQNEVGKEAAVPATIVLIVTFDDDAFLASSFDFIAPTLTNMVKYQLRLNSRQLWVTNTGSSFTSVPSSFSDHTNEPLANYHSVAASEWLSETHDFGLLLTGNWLLTHDVTALSGNVQIDLELSIAGFGIDSTTFAAGAKGAFRFARVRISTTNPPGTDTAFVKSPLMNLKVTVVPIEESGSGVSNATAGTPSTVILSREYSALKEISVQPLNSIEPLTAIVDNIVIGPNTGVLFDGISYLQTPDLAAHDFGTGDFSFEFWALNDGTTDIPRHLLTKRANGLATGWQCSQLSNGAIRITIDDGGPAGTVELDTAGGTFPDDGKWHHIGVSVDRTADLIKVRIDKVERLSSSIAAITLSISNTAQLTIGARSDGNGVFEGSLDEVRLWNDLRTPAEFDANQDTQLVGLPAGLAGYWKLEGTLTTVVTTISDETLNGATMTETGAGVLTYIDPSSGGNPLIKINSFDVFIFDLFGQQLAVDYQWNWKGV